MSNQNELKQQSCICRLIWWADVCLCSSDSRAPDLPLPPFPLASLHLFNVGIKAVRSGICADRPPTKATKQKNTVRKYDYILFSKYSELLRIQNKSVISADWEEVLPWFPFMPPDYCLIKKEEPNTWTDKIVRETEQMLHIIPIMLFYILFYIFFINIMNKPLYQQFLKKLFISNQLQFTSLLVLYTLVLYFC